MVVEGARRHRGVIRSEEARHARDDQAQEDEVPRYLIRPVFTNTIALDRALFSSQLFKSLNRAAALSLEETNSKCQLSLVGYMPMDVKISRVHDLTPVLACQATL